MTTKIESRIRRKRDPGGNLPPGSLSLQAELFLRVAFTEYRHYMIRVERDFLPTGLIMTAVRVSAIAACFCSIVNSGLSIPRPDSLSRSAGLLASFILASFALQFRLVRFHARQRRPVPFREYWPFS